MAWLNQRLHAAGERDPYSSVSVRPEPAAVGRVDGAAGALVCMDADLGEMS